MSVAPFPIQVLRDSKWSVLQSDELLPGDVVSLGIYTDFKCSCDLSDTIQCAAINQKPMFQQTCS